MRFLTRSHCVPRRLLLHSSNACSYGAVLHADVLSRCKAAFCMSRSRSLTQISTLAHPQCQSSISNLSLRSRSVSHISSSRPAVPNDEYEELKDFLAKPVNVGPSMERAKEIVTGWMNQHVDPSMPGQDATVMVMVASAMEDPYFVMQVYTCLRDAGVSPSPITLEYSAAACAQLGQWRTAFEIIDFMHQAVNNMQPSLSIYENAIESCHKAKKWIKAKHLLEEMRTYGLIASIKLYKASIRLCIVSEEVTATQVLFDALCCAHEEELERETKKEIMTDLFNAAVDVQSLPQSLFFREKLLADKFCLSKKDYTHLVRLCAVKRQWHMARVLLQQSVDMNAPPPVAAASSRYTDEIIPLLNEMKENDMEKPLIVYNAALRNFGQLSLLKNAMAVYSDMQKENIVPDATSFAALLCSCGSNVEQSEAYFREFQLQNCDPSLDVMHAYLLVPSRAKQWNEVLRRYDMIQHDACLQNNLTLNSDVRIQSLLAVAYGRVDRSKDMLRIFTSMKVKGMEPNLHVYGEAMFAYIRQDQWRHALMLFDHLFQQQTPEMQENRRLDSFPMIWDAAVLACVHGGKTRRAAVLYDTIIGQRILISMVTGERLAKMLKSIPSEILWKSFKSIPSLHKTKNNDKLNPRVQNAILKRAVEENDIFLAERIVDEGTHQMKILPNSMTYALMLRLYSSQEDQVNFYAWWCRMEQANVKPTLYVFRALMRHLSYLSIIRDSVTSLNTFAVFLEQRQCRNEIEGAKNNESTKDFAARLGQGVLDKMSSRRMRPDAICLQNYLLLSQESDHVARALDNVEDAISARLENGIQSVEDCVDLTPRLLHTLFTALAGFPDGQRVRELLVQIVKVLPSDLSENALAAFCAANDGLHALQLLRELLDGYCALTDEHVYFFLTNSYTCEASTVETETSRPRSGDGVIVDIAALLCANAAVTMKVECISFLMHHIVKLSKWQQRGGYEVSTQMEIDSMKKLLAHAFSTFSVTQVQAFLGKVIHKDDHCYLESILIELQNATF
ncbi:hypothetical protein CCR75_009714 [Bremia lactucae]|uniref:Uncharacterized protein n=1 Tax=Bremia lactucae TaxID=4779 RepID=A0A976ICT6_BRELC|nr:hypothetical protein CCR75_009714 [Bremia lactucae]